MSDVTIEEIELTITQATNAKNRGISLRRLYDNKDFKEIILEGYFTDHACQLVELKAAPAMQNDKQQTDILKSIDGIGALQQHFNAIYQQADIASTASDQGNEELADMSRGL